MVEIGDFFNVYYSRMVSPKRSVYEDLYWTLQDPVEKLKTAQRNLYGKKKRLRKRGMTLENLRRYLPPERQKRVVVLDDFINELVDEGVTRYKEICNITLEDGTYLVNQNRLDFHNLWWWTIMEGMEEYDLILTNEILVDIELNMPLVALVRGGISTGFASNSISRYNGVAVMSTFPLIFKHPLFIRWRGKEIPEGEMEEVFGTYSCHELGHLLLHYLHPSDYPGSIMNPARGLNYYQWYEEVQKYDLKSEKNPEGGIFDPENERWIRWYKKIWNNWKVLKDIPYEELIEMKKNGVKIFQE